VWLAGLGDADGNRPDHSISPVRAQHSSTTLLLSLEFAKALKNIDFKARVLEYLGLIIKQDVPAESALPTFSSTDSPSVTTKTKTDSHTERTSTDNQVPKTTVGAKRKRTPWHQPDPHFHLESGLTADQKQKVLTSPPGEGSFRTLVYACQMHSKNHKATCFKYNHKTCRAGFEKPLVAESYISESGAIILRRSHGWVNNYIAPVLRCIKVGFCQCFINSHMY
jgi:hypothetical protein